MRCSPPVPPNRTSCSTRLARLGLAVLAATVAAGCGLPGYTVTNRRSFESRTIALEEMPAARGLLPAALDEITPAGRASVGDFAVTGAPRHEPIHRFATGRRPKQVVFSPDGRTLVVPLLDDDGVDLISIATGRTVRLRVPGRGRFRGFVEATFHGDGRTFLVTQMTTGEVHRFSAQGVLLGSYPTGGRWSKVVAVSPDGQLVAVSNWLSDTVTLLEAGSGRAIGVLEADGATVPRGLAFTPDGLAVVVGYFGSGDLIRYSVESRAVLARVRIGGANRHVVVHPDGRRVFVSNMAAGRVVVLSLDELRVLADVPVDANPNTIALSPDGTRLYVSCRGPNDPVSYERRSPRDGSIYCIDTRTLDVLEVIPAGNQPTGLAVSRDGTLIAGTNFQDDTVVVYRVPFQKRW